MILPLRIQRQAAVFLFFAALFALLAGYAMSRAGFSYRPKVEPVALQGKWIRPPGDLDFAGCFRKTIFLNSSPKQAWLMISAQDGFEVIVNGNTVDHLFLWRPTRQFQSGLSEVGQRLIKSQSLLSLNFPREYQWGSHRSYEIPIFMDLTPYLKPGVNTLCVMIETRKIPARFNLSGEIATFSGQTLSIVSDASWKAASAPSYSGLLEWVKPHFDDQNWAQAIETTPPPGQSVRLLDPAIYRRMFSALLIEAPIQSNTSDVWFESDWELSSKPRDAWLRMVSNRPYDLFVNGHRVNSENTGSLALDAGDWIIGTQRALDPAESPDLLDPDEVGTLEESNRFLSPPHTDPTANDFHTYQDTENRTTDHPYAGGPDGPQQKPLRGSEQAPPLTVYAPQSRAPAPLKRDRRLEEFNAYSIGALLRSGSNHVSVRLLPSQNTIPLDWSPTIALDAGATSPDGSRKYLETGPGWHAVSRDARGETVDIAQAVPGGPARAMAFSLPPMQYRGFVYSQGEKAISWIGCVVASLVVVLGAAFGALWRHEPTRWALFVAGPVRREEAAPVRLYIAKCTQVVLLPGALLGAACLVQAAWGERQEILWFYSGEVWAVLLAAALLLMAACIYRLFFSPQDVLSISVARAGSFMERVPESLAWKVIVLWLLLLCFFLPVYRMDYHPIDDDEYASIEGSVAISKYGVPRYSDDVWYTRSPLYHYMDGAVIHVFGENIWSMRLPSVLWGVATAWLTYLCGRRLLNSPWVGLGALSLYIVHPFMIYSAHIARFYQQQQFFALLTIYCFCRGFVAGQSQRARFATIFAFLCCVLSQELSLVLGVQLAFGYFLFANRKPWRDEIRLTIAAGCALAIIVTDLLVFQTRCLTHTEGVSPSVEATLHPQFANPLNFLSIFVAYSRLHLALSALFLLGVPFALKNKNRNLLALYFFVFSGAIFTNLLVTGDSLRYQYWLIPIWLLLGVYGPKAVMDYLDEVLSPEALSSRARHAWVRPMLSAMLYVAAFLSLSPWRILDSYDAKLLGDSTGAFQFVRANLRPGDVVAATEPHPHGALMETGRSDYDISFPRLYDFIYLKNGRLIDRNAGAESVSSVDELVDIFAKHDRAWIVINREKFRSRGENIRWEYPGARAELLLRRNCTVAYQAYLWTVFLWDSHNGRYQDFRTDFTE